MEIPQFSVFDMVHSVVADSKKKLAAEKAKDEDEKMEGESEEDESEDSDDEDEGGAPPFAKKDKKESEKEAAYHLKVAEACDFLADNFVHIDDDRDPREKLAELVALQEQLRKVAEDVPMTPPLDDGGINPGGPQSAMKAEPVQQSGENTAEAGQMGKATPAHQSPTTTAPTEKVLPAEQANALPTNKDMMMDEQPEDVLKQSSDESDVQAGALLGLFRGEYQDKEAAFKSEEQKRKFTANAAKAVAAQDPAKPGAETAGGGSLKKASLSAEVIAASGLPAKLAQALAEKVAATKQAEDAINPAAVAAGTKPDLQTSSKSPSPAMNQGQESGEKTPEQAKGQREGRQLIQSNEAAINATKKDAKTPVKSPLAEVLTEPALSSAHDPVLQQSLSSTSEAGVKISAASRELLKKLAASSPEAKEWVDHALKCAMAGMPIPAPGEEVGGAAEALSAAPEVSDEAMTAAAEGVTTDELAKAQTLLAQEAQEAASATAASQPPVEAEAAGEGAAPEAAPAPAQA